MDTSDQQTTQRPKRRRGSKALWLGLFVVLAVVVGLSLWQQMQFERLRKPLIEAVKAGDTAEVRTLLAAGADPNVRLDYEPEPFSWAKLRQTFQGVKADTSSTSNTVLMEAASTNHYETVRLLLEYGADVNLMDNAEDFSTALALATRSGAVESMKMLLAHGASIKERTTGGSRYLWAALENDISSHYDRFVSGGESCVCLLLEVGADVNERNDEGNTLLLLASKSPYPSRLISLLLQHHADVKVRDRSGRTALMSAVNFHPTATIEALLDAGADINAQNEYGDTALHELIECEPDIKDPRVDRNAIWHGRQIIALLLERGANLSLKNRDGRTPLQLARKGIDPEVIALLRKAAARTSGAGKGAGN